MDLKTYWETVFQTKSPAQTSWHTPHLEHSLRWIREAGLSPAAEIIDVGAGQSTLIGDLLAGGYTHLTALDISESALSALRLRLCTTASTVRWIAGDVTEVALPARRFDLWHDRAVFHFLVEPEHRKRYVDQLKHALKPGAQVLVATFGPDGPTRCRGLETRRYDSASLASELGQNLTLAEAEISTHTTPAGNLQQFLHARFAFSPSRHS